MTSFFPTHVDHYVSLDGCLAGRLLITHTRFLFISTSVLAKFVPHMRRTLGPWLYHMLGG